MKNRTWLCVVVFLSRIVPSALAADFYIDPAKGDAANDGSTDRPWASLQAVLDGKVIESREWDKLPYKHAEKLVPKNPGARVKAGDTLWLRTGDYGDLRIVSYYNTGPITLAAEKGARPRFRSVLVQSSSHWVLRGLHVSPEYGEGKPPRTLVFVNAHGWRGAAEDIVIEDCVLQSTADSSGWSTEDWNTRTSSGITSEGTRITIRGNRMKNVDSGITMSGPHALVERNHVENFCGDGMRGNGDHSVFQYNTVKNCYDVNDNHDDGFQSWSHGPKGVGTSEVRDVVLRGNTIINYEDPQQPHLGTLQGIGCFDGMYVDWVIEDNVVLVDHYHGITLGGAINCRIEHNTVIDPNDVRPGPAAIRVSKHKKGMPSTHCVIRNNLATAISVSEGEGMVSENNSIVKDRDAFFVDFVAGDLRLKPDSPANGAGARRP